MIAYGQDLVGSSIPTEGTWEGLWGSLRAAGPFNELPPG